MGNDRPVSRAAKRGRYLSSDSFLENAPGRPAEGADRPEVGGKDMGWELKRAPEEWINAGEADPRGVNRTLPHVKFDDGIRRTLNGPRGARSRRDPYDPPCF
jgi:hypothetical protein